MGTKTSTRLKTGLIAFALVLAQVVMPVQSAFATDGGTVEAQRDKQPKKVYVCKYVGKPGVDERLQTGQNPIEVSHNAVGDTPVGQYYEPFKDGHDRSYVLGYVVAGQPEPSVTDCPNVVDVSKISVTTLPNCGPNNDTVVISPSPLTGVTYTQGAWNNNTLTVTATLQAGYSWSDGTVSPSKTFTVNDAGTVCEREVQLPTPVMVDPCGPNNASWATQAASTEYTWSQQNGDLVVTATAGNYFMVNGKKVYSNNFGKAVDSGKECPKITPCRTLKDTIIVSSKEQFADTDESRSSGKYEFTNDGVKIYTIDSSSNAKVAWYKNVDIAMGDLGVPAMDYQLLSGTQTPGLQLRVDFDGNGTADGLLVGESVYGNNWWLTGGSAQFARDGAPHVGGGNGSQWYGTLDEWYGAFQQARVKQVGFSLGSGVLASGVLKSMTFGCVKYVFKKTYVAAEPVMIDKCGRLDDKFTIPKSEGVDYYVLGFKIPAGTYPVLGGSVTITAKAKTGYILTGKTQWTLNFTDEKCEPSVDVKLKTYCDEDGQMFDINVKNDTRSSQRYQVVITDSEGNIEKSFKVDVSLFGDKTVSWLATESDTYTVSVYSYNDGERGEEALWTKTVKTECATDVFTPEIYKVDQDGLYVPARFTVVVCQYDMRGKETCKTYEDVNFGMNGDWFANNVDYDMYEKTKVTITETYTPGTCTADGPWTFTWDTKKQNDDKLMIDSLTFSGGSRHDDDGMGSWSNGSNVWTLLNRCTPGQGSTGGTPVTPAGGAGALPAELPMTGTGGTLTTWFALLAAVLTYGAVYLLQPKKRVEE